MVTNSDNIPGYKIIKSHGIVTARRLYSDVLLYGDKERDEVMWENAYEGLLQKLESNANKRGGNAVISVNSNILQHIRGTISGMIAVVLTGTAVSVEKIGEEEVEKSSHKDKITCPQCGTVQRSNRKVCLNCGKQLDP